MRKKLISLVVFACVSAALMIPTWGLGQQRGGDQGRTTGAIQFQQGQGAWQGMPGQGGQMIMQGQGGKGGKNQMKLGGMNFDMNGVFDAMAQGKSSVSISSLGPLAQPLQQWARDNGNTTGIINRQQFNSFAQSYLGSMQAGLGAAGKGKGGKGNPDATAETRFKSADKNSDGRLAPEEMSSQLRDSGVWKIYDRDKNSSLSLEEYKSYWREYTAAQQGFGVGGKGNTGFNSNTILIDDSLDQRPVVYRAGKLPKELPAWFTQYDTDKDAQIGLYEWRLSQEPYMKFEGMDRNQDSLLTAEEVLWHLKSIASIGSQNGTVASFAQAGQGAGGFTFNDFAGKGKGKKGGANAFGGGFGGGGANPFAIGKKGDFGAFGGGKKGGGNDNGGGKGGKKKGKGGDGDDF